MTKNNDNPTHLNGRQVNSQTDQSDNVGYGNPPKHSQFKKGHSGNPKGRPKGAKNKHTFIKIDNSFRVMFDKIRLKKVPIKRAGGIVEEVSTDEAVAESLSVQAMLGKPLALRTYISIVQKFDEHDQDITDQWIEHWVKYKSHWNQELERRKRHGETHLKLPIPHPDNVIIDTASCSVNIRGPVDERAMKELESYSKLLRSKKEGMAKLHGDLVTYADDPSSLTIIKDDIKHAETLISILEKRIGNEDDDLEPWEIYEKYIT